MLLAVLGGAGVVLLHQLGGRIDAILRENYDSVRAMERLNEALERIESSFQLALAGKEKDAKASFDENWERYDEQLRIEQNNITILPEEERLVRQLERLTEQYRKLGKDFYQRRPGDLARQTDYSGKENEPGLMEMFHSIKKVSTAILQLNQKNMEDASRDAKATARTSIRVLIGCVATASLLAIALVWRLVHSILGPVEAVTRAAQAIGAGKLDHLVPVHRHDEIGQFAETFNKMIERLRSLRHTNLQKLFRAQQTGQATIDSFPDPILVVDPEGRLEMANLAARQVLGVAPPTEGRTAQPWLPPEPFAQPLTMRLASTAGLSDGVVRSSGLLPAQRRGSGVLAADSAHPRFPGRDTRGSGRP